MTVIKASSKIRGGTETGELAAEIIDTSEAQPPEAPQENEKDLSGVTGNVVSAWGNLNLLGMIALWIVLLLLILFVWRKKKQQEN